uniref:Beta sliding clamp n=1 Tax=Candidatus Aschnera chinzeii TaxID=1485666 RepID=A0AAT9G3N8_9ENTR|nr:MAG: DNA polymerase III subunit beta [Candidatus Aschnera chinzeii]
MKFTIIREELLKPLYQVNTTLSGKPKLPILANILLKINNQILLLITTDLEIEIIAKILITENSENGSITVSARKFYDICRGLPKNSIIKIRLNNNKLIIKSNKSTFILSTLPSSDFPNLDNWNGNFKCQIAEIYLKDLIESTQFSMASNDIRYYLNGMLIEITNNEIRSITTDGHRLAFSYVNIDQNLHSHSIIIPRKSISELIRLLNDSNNMILIESNNNNIRFHINNLIFTSKLIDGQFPDYHRILSNKSNKILTACREELKKAFIRSAILSNNKFQGSKLTLNNNQLKITSNNFEDDTSEEVIEVNYPYEMLEINFNINYIIDVLNILKCKDIKCFFNNANSSIKIESAYNATSSYIIMPIRI